MAEPLNLVPQIEQRQEQLPTEATPTVSNTSTATINVDPFNSIDAQPAISMGEEVAQAWPVSEAAADQLSFKVHYGLGDILKKSRDEIYNDILVGGEGAIRQDAAAQIDARKRQAVNNAITDLAKQRNNGFIMGEDIDFLTKSIQSMDAKTDPDSVFETAYGKQYLAALQRAGEKAMSTSFLSQARREQPKETADTIRIGEELVAKSEFLNSLAEKTQTMYDDQSWIGWTADQAKFLVPLYSDFKLRGQNPDVGRLEGLLGTNMEEQGKALFALPFDQFKARTNQIMEKLSRDNPTAAIMFIKALQGMTTSDVVLNNVLPLIDVATLPVGGIAKAAAEKIGLFNATRSAVRTQLKDIATAPTKSVIAGAAGDLEEAGIQKATTAITADLKGLSQPTKEAMEALPSGLRTDISDIRANPGRFGQEIANKLAEEYTQGQTSLFGRLLESLKVSRLGDALSAETTVRALWDEARNSYPGIKNRIIDISKPIYEPISNTWHMKMNIGDGPGIFFSSRQTAENFAREMGLSGVEYASKEGVDVGASRALTASQIKKMTSLEKTVKEMEEKTIPNLEKRSADETLSAKDRARAAEDLEGVREILVRYKGDLDAYRAPPSSKTYYIPEAAVKRNWETKTRFGEVKNIEGTPRFFTDDGVEVVMSKTGGEGMIPVNVGKDGSVKFGKAEAKTKTFYVPEAAIKRSWESDSRLGEVKNVNGTPRYYTDDGAEVVLSETGGDGMVALRVAQDGTVKFGPPPEITIEPQGVGFYISKTIPINETGPAIQSAILREVETEGSRAFSPKGLLNEWIGFLRTPEETMSQLQRENRKIATTGASIFRGIMQDNAREIKELMGWKNLTNTQRWKDWKRVVEAGADLRDPETGLRGYFFRSPGELETYYQQNIGRLPDEKEIRAYFAFKRGMEYDRIFRNIAVYRNMSRVGAEHHTFYMLDAAGKRTASPEFAGVVQKELPKGEGIVLMTGKSMGDEKLYANGHIPSKIRQELEEGIKTGKYRAIEVYAPEQRPFANFGENVGNNRVRWVISDSVETKPLNWENVPRRGGGHIDYDYDFYLKQAKVTKSSAGNTMYNTYEGDTTVLGAPIRAMGQDVAKHLNEVRKLLGKQDLAGAEAYSKQNLHIDWEEVSSWFMGKKGPDGKMVQPYLSLDQPIEVVPRGKATIDMSKRLEQEFANFSDGTRSGSLAKQFQVEFTGERDAHDFMGLAINKGSKNDPLYAVTSADKLDPLAVMNRGLARIIDSNFMDDYKIMSIEHWLAEAAPHLTEPRSAIRHSPFWHFNNAANMFSRGTDEGTKRRLMAQHMQIQQLVGIQSSTDAMLHSAAQKIADSVYSKFGTSGLVIDPSYILPTLRDPFRFIRSITFNTTMGLFNFPQFIVQSMNYVNILGIAGPRYAVPGTYASQLHFWSTVNRHPAIIDHLDAMASKMKFPGTSGWKPGEFKEAMKEMDKTGFGNVGREYAALDDVASNKVVTGAWGDFLEWGNIFFKGGERNARYGAWYTAFKEWRDANPLAKITDADRAKILDRADLLNTNMTRASSSRLHTGVMSIPFQFLTYQLRVFELFTGKRLTGMERARLLGVNAMMYGIPVAAGVTGLPTADYIRKYATDNGYVVGENFLSSMAMEGIPSMFMAMATSDNMMDPKKGNFYNFGDRYGTGGFKTVNDMFNPDKTMWDIFGGASFSKLKSTWEGTSGFRSAMMSVIRGDENYFPVTVDDVADVAKEISAFNSAWRLGVALNTGRWTSKKETYISDVSPANAVFQSLTGMTPQDVSDVYRKSERLQDIKNLEKHTQKMFLREFRRFIEARQDNNEELARDYMVRARAYLIAGGYPEDRIVSLVKQAYDDNKSLVDRIDWQFYLKAGNAARKEQMREPFRQKLILQNDKQQEQVNPNG